MTKRNLFDYQMINVHYAIINTNNNEMKIFNLLTGEVLGDIE